MKSVYAEYLPPSWDEEKVMDFFKRFGEIESVSLAKNLPSSKRKDFAFVNYAMREAALACIEAFSHGQADDEGYKVFCCILLYIVQIPARFHRINLFTSKHFS